MTPPTEPFDPTAHFDENLAAKYERRIRLFCPNYDALHQMITRLLQPMGERASHLSAGAGTGAEIVNLGTQFPFWRFLAIDVSADMLKACRVQIAQVGMTDRVEFFNGRLQEYRSPVPFDAASSVFVAHFIKGREAKLEYFRSVAANLKRGGLFVLADLFGDKGTPNFEKLMNAWLLSYASQRISVEELVQDKTHIERDVDFLSERELVALLNEAGFVSPVRFYQTFLFGGWVAKKQL